MKFHLIGFILLTGFLYQPCFAQVDSLKRIIATSQNSEEKVDLIISLSEKYLSFNLDSSLYWGRQGLMLSRKLNYLKGSIKALNVIGNYYQRISKYDSSHHYYSQIIPLAEALHDTMAFANTYNNIAILYTNQAAYDTALILYYKGLKYEELLNNEHGMAQSFLNIGVVHFYMGNISQSLNYIKRSTEMEEHLGKKDVALKGYNNLGAISEYYAKNLDSAAYFYMKCIEMAKELNELKDLAIGSSNLSRVFASKGDTTKALVFANDAFRIREQTGDQEGLISSLLTLSDLSRVLKEQESYIKKALKISEAIKAPNLKKECLSRMINLSVRRNDYKRAFEFQEAVIALKDSIFTAEKDSKILELQTKYETEKKEQQIALQEVQLSEQQAQNQRNTILIWSLAFVVFLLAIIILLVRSRAKKKQDLLLKEAELKLQESLLSSSISSQENERKRFARDLHDGFGQMISVLNLNLSSLEKGTADKESIFENSSRVLDDMYKELKSICFNLMPETLIKNGVVDALREFAGRINLAEKVHVKVDAFGIQRRLPDLVEINLYRISQEWINNVIKYSDATAITVQITKDETEITLLIEDNGSGFEKRLLTEGKGNGWKNMQSRTNLLKGELVLDTTSGQKGNTLILNVPVEIPTQPVVQV